MKVEGLEEIARGVGSRAKYLECVRGPKGQLIAKQWRESKPATFDVLIALKGAKEYAKDAALTCKACGKPVPELEVFPGPRCLACHAKKFDREYANKPLPRPDFMAALKKPR